MRKIRGLANEGPSALVFAFWPVFSFLMKTFPSAALGVLLSISLGGCFSQERQILSKTVLSVNGKDISTKEFADRLALRLKGYDALYAKDEVNLDRAKEDTVQAFLIESITRSYASKHDVRISPAEVDAQVSEIRMKYPDDFAFRRALADENLSLEKWKQDLEFTLLQKKIVAVVTANMDEPSTAEMRAYYEANKAQYHQPARVRLRQVVLEKEDDAKRILDELGRGVPLERLAKKFSIAPESAKGGDTGWIEKGTLDVFDLAFKMPVGSRSKLLKSPYGWHIFEVLKKEPEAHLSFEAAKDKIRAHLMEAKTQKAFAAWLEEEVRKSSVKRNDVLIHAIKVSTRGS